MGMAAASRRRLFLHTLATIRLPNLTRSMAAPENLETSSLESAAGADPSNEDLISLVCQGDPEALGLLFHRYARVVHAIAYRVLRDASETDDLVQDIFVLIHRLCGTFDSSKASAQFWILQMTYRRAISRRRYLSSRHFYTRVELDEQEIQMAKPQSGQFDDTEQILAELDLQKMFGTLSEDQQRTLRLHFIEGYTLDEIAKMLGQTKGNVRHHSFRGLERLRKQIFGSKLPGARAI
jgi:RNA polymerase sigma-70 factor (ECF subfamily)